MNLLFGCTAVVSSHGIDCAVAKLCQLAYRLSPICGLQINFQVKWKTRQKREKTAPADLLLFQKRLEARIQLFQELKEMESVAMNKVICLSYAKSVFMCS